MNTHLPARKEMHTTHLQLMQLLQPNDCSLAITASLTSLFALLKAGDGNLHDSGLSGHDKINLLW